MQKASVLRSATVFSLTGASVSPKGPNSVPLVGIDLGPEPNLTAIPSDAVEGGVIHGVIMTLPAAKALINDLRTAVDDRTLGKSGGGSEGSEEA